MRRADPHEARVARAPTRAGSASPAAAATAPAPGTGPTPPSERSRWPSRAPPARTGRPSAHRADGPEDRDHVEQGGRERGDAEALLARSACPWPRRRRTRAGRNGIITRVRRTVSSALPGPVVEAGRQERDDRRGEDDPAAPPGRPAPRPGGSAPGSRAAKRGLLAPLLRASGRRSGRRRPRAHPPRRGRAAGSGSGRPIRKASEW